MNAIPHEKWLRLTGIQIVLILAFGTPLFAFDGTVDKNYGVAIEGYDAVAYFTVGEAVAGRPDHQFNWNEATWYFASEKHRAMFAENPEQYAPSHSGLCAVSMVVGSLVEPDPRAWKIVDGKLHLGWKSLSSGRFAAD